MRQQASDHRAILSSLHQKHRRRSRWVWNDELMLCEVPQCLLNIFSALAAEPKSRMYSPSFSALLTFSNSCQLSAMSRPPGHTNRAAGSGSSSVAGPDGARQGHPGQVPCPWSRREYRQERRAWASPSAASDWTRAASRAASVWTRGGRYSFGLDRCKLDPKAVPDRISRFWLALSVTRAFP